MAKEAKPEAEETEVAPPKSSKKLLVIIAVALVLLLAIGGAAGYFLMKGSHDPEGEDAEAIAEKTKTDKKKNEKPAAPVYVAMEAFTVNLVPETGDQFLQLILSIEVSNLQVGDRLKMYTPKIRNNVMMMLSGKKASELLTREGKETLANEIKDLMNEVLEGTDANPDDPPVREVLFTSFIIQ